MRILFASHYALPHLGGIESVVDALAAELAARGHEVVHVASDAVRFDDPPGDDGPPRAYKLIRVPAVNSLESRLGVPYPVFSPGLGSVLRRAVARADVVHAHGMLYMSSVAALLTAWRRRGGPARVLTEHVGHVGYANRLVDGCERVAIATVGGVAVRAAQATIVLNDRVAGEVGRLSAGPPPVVIPNGADLVRFRPPALGERAAIRAGLGWDERPRVLFVGRLVAKKGIDLAIAAARAAEGAFELVVVGPGAVAAPPAGVTLYGARSRNELAELYRAADAFLLPSRGEGFPVTAQEAMASGLPVLLREDPSYAGYARAADPGLVLVAPNAEEIARRVTRLCSDAAALSRAGRAASAFARERFSWGRAVDEHERIYTETLRAH